MLTEILAIFCAILIVSNILLLVVFSIHPKGGVKMLLSAFLLTIAVVNIGMATPAAIYFFTLFNNVVGTVVIFLLFVLVGAGSIYKFFES